MNDADGVSRIGIVDDHGQIVRGLSATFADRTDIRVVATGGTVGEILDSAEPIDLVLLDLRLDDESTPHENIGRLREAGIPVLVYTSGDEVFLMRQAATAGALGLIRKNARDSELFDAISEAAAGRAVPTADWASALESDPDFVDLSPRLRRVLELYAAGESNAGVAKSLNISTDTVSEYISRIRHRYSAVGRDAPTKTELFKRAIEDGWLPIPRRRKRR